MTAGQTLASLLLLLFSFESHANWPEEPWLNGQPRPGAIATALAFASPSDLQFLKIMNAWKTLARRYEAQNVDFLLVAKGEMLLPFSEPMVEGLVRDGNYQLPVLLDRSASYSKVWKAYVSPTVYLILKNGKVTNLEPGSFDPAAFEKILQKTLKDNGVSPLPQKEFSSEGETKICGHGHTAMLGDRFQKAWGSVPIQMDETWTPKELWLEKRSVRPGKIDFSFSHANTGIIAEPIFSGAIKVTLTLDGAKIPSSLKGRDVQEDRAGETYLVIKSPKIYEIISHSGGMSESNSVLRLSTSGNGLKLWAFQTLPPCHDL